MHKGITLFHSLCFTKSDTLLPYAFSTTIFNTTEEKVEKVQWIWWSQLMMIITHSYYSVILSLESSCSSKFYLFCFHLSRMFQPNQEKICRNSADVQFSVEFLCGFCRIVTENSGVYRISAEVFWLGIHVLLGWNIETMQNFNIDIKQHQIFYI